jgi:hypothetical protein
MLAWKSNPVDPIQLKPDCCYLATKRTKYIQQCPTVHLLDCDWELSLFDEGGVYWSTQDIVFYIEVPTLPCSRSIEDYKEALLDKELDKWIEGG